VFVAKAFLDKTTLVSDLLFVFRLFTSPFICGLTNQLTLATIQASYATGSMARVPNLQHRMFMMNSPALTSNTKIVVGALAAVITNAFDWIHTTIIADAWVYLTVLDSSLFCHVFNKQTFK
jgi:hypothetical protein